MSRNDGGMDCQSVRYREEEGSEREKNIDKVLYYLENLVVGFAFEFTA